MVKTMIISEGTVINDLPTFSLNEFGETINFHLYNRNGSAFDLTDYIIVFIAKKLNDFNENLFTRVVNITNTTSGYCEVEFVDGDLDEIGSFDCSLELTKTGSNVIIPLGYLSITE